jgi:hypothetical protein
MGEAGQLAEGAERGAQLSNVAIRCRWPALEALRTLYPRCRLASLGEMVGANSNVVPRLAQAKASGWWSDEVAEIAMRAVR